MKAEIIMNPEIMAGEIKRLSKVCHQRGNRMNELADLLHRAVNALGMYQCLLGDKISEERYKEYEKIISEYAEIG